MLYPLSYGGSARDYRSGAASGSLCTTKARRKVMESPDASAVPELGERGRPDRVGPEQAVASQRVDGCFLQALGPDR